MAYRELADYVLDQLSGLDGVRSIPMMGGWLFYIHDRIFGGIYGGGRVMVKDTPASRRTMPDAEPEPPYDGAKPMLPLLILDDREQFARMVSEMFDELPEPKPRRRRGRRDGV